VVSLDCVGGFGRGAAAGGGPPGYAGGPANTQAGGYGPPSGGYGGAPYGQR